MSGTEKAGHAPKFVDGWIRPVDPPIDAVFDEREGCCRVVCGVCGSKARWILGGKKAGVPRSWPRCDVHARSLCWALGIALPKALGGRQDEEDGS